MFAFAVWKTHKCVLVVLQVHIIVRTVNGTTALHVHYCDGKNQNRCTLSQTPVTGIVPYSLKLSTLRHRHPRPSVLLLRRQEHRIGPVFTLRCLVNLRRRLGSENTAVTHRSRLLNTIAKNIDTLNQRSVTIPLLNRPTEKIHSKHHNFPQEKIHHGLAETRKILQTYQLRTV